MDAVSDLNGTATINGFSTDRDKMHQHNSEYLNTSLSGKSSKDNNGEHRIEANGQVNGHRNDAVEKMLNESHPAKPHSSADGRPATDPPRPYESEPIAIVGMACRFAGDAANVKGLWDMCCEGRSAWTEIPENRMHGQNFFHPNFSKRGTVRTNPSCQVGKLDIDKGSSMRAVHIL